MEGHNLRATWMSSTMSPPPARSQTLRPDRANYVIGIVFLSTLAVIGCALPGWVAAEFLRRIVYPDQIVLAAALAAWLAVVSFSLTQAANMSVFQLVFSQNSLTIRSVLHSDLVDATSINETFYSANIKYQHIIIRTGEKYRVASSLLWNNSLFHDVVLERFSAWCKDNSVPSPCDIDLVSFGLSSEQKRVRKGLRASLTRDWLIYAAFFILLTVAAYLICGLFRPWRP